MQTSRIIRIECTIQVGLPLGPDSNVRLGTLETNEIVKMYVSSLDFKFSANLALLITARLFHRYGAQQENILFPAHL